MCIDVRLFGLNKTKKIIWCLYDTSLLQLIRLMVAPCTVRFVRLFFSKFPTDKILDGI